MKRFLNNSLLIILVFMGAGDATVWAKSDSDKNALSKYVETGMDVSGVSYPHYNEEGELQARVFIHHAVLLENSRVQITNLKIELYSDGKVSATIFAPICFSNIDITSGEAVGEVLEVESDGPVLIETEQFTLSGKGFVLRSDKKNSRFKILNESKMLVKKEARKQGGLKL